MTQRLSPQGLSKLLGLLGGTDLVGEAVPVRAVVLGSSSTVSADLDVAETLDGVTTLDLYDDGGSGPYRSDATCTVVVDDSVVRVTVADTVFTALPPQGDGGSTDLARFVLLYLPQKAPEEDSSSIPLLVVSPDFAGVPPDGTDYTVVWPTTGVLRVETG